MADPRFHTVKGPFTLAELAGIARAELHPGADPAKRIVDVAPLDEAGGDQIAFIDNPRYLSAFRRSRAGACIVHPERLEEAPAGMALLVSKAPYMAYALVARAFYPEPVTAAGRDDAAHIDPSALVAADAAVGPGAVIGARAEIGARSVIGAGAVIGDGVLIGEDCRVGAGASLAFCLVGDRVRIAAGARIGEAGFGFATGADGHVTVPQLGRVVIENDVDIGSNTTIDRGAGPDTVIGAGTRIDNLVQIGHNVRIGRGCIIVAQVGISGSTQLHDYVVLGGQAGLTGHLTVGEGAQIGAQAGVMKDVPPGEKMGGSPALPIRQRLRQVALLARLDRKGRDGNG